MKQPSPSLRDPHALDRHERDNEVAGKKRSEPAQNHHTQHRENHQGHTKNDDDQMLTGLLHGLPSPRGKDGDQDDEGEGRQRRHPETYLPKEIASAQTLVVPPAGGKFAAVMQDGIEQNEAEDARNVNQEDE